MLTNTRSLIPIGLVSLLLAGSPACGNKKNDTPEPQPEAVTTSSAGAKQRPSLRGPLGPQAKIDPQVRKDYLLDLCYYGTLTLRQARESYLTSLGKDEPSEKKIPNFGIPTTPSALPPTAIGPGLSAKPITPPPPPVASARAAAGSAKAASSAAPQPDRRPFEFALRAPHERNARACKAILSIKEPPMGDVDTAAAAFAPFAEELAKDIVAANMYYQREEYKKDKLAQGKELHKKLLDGFQKLDELQDKLGNALTAWRKDHPADPAKQDPGEKEITSRLTEARTLVLAAVAKKIDLAAYKDALSKLEVSVPSLKEWSAGHADDVWGKIMVGPFEVFLKSAKELKIDKAFDADGMLALINNFTNLIETRQRAASRAMVAKGQTQNPGQPAGLPPGHPPMNTQ